MQAVITTTVCCLNAFISIILTARKGQNVFMYVSVVPESFDTQTASPSLPSLYTFGCLASSSYHLKDEHATEGYFFIFPDIRVRVLGQYKLYFNLFERNKTFYRLIGSLLSNTFKVYTARQFPGLTKSTPLIQTFWSQGVKSSLYLPESDKEETKLLFPDVNMDALRHAQSFKAHEEHLLLLLNTGSASELQNYDYNPVSMAIQGIGNWLSNSDRCTAIESAAGPRTSDSYRLITSAAILSQGLSPASLQCQLLQVIYYFLTTELKFALKELQNLGQQLYRTLSANPTVNDEVAAVFWAYVILDSYSLVSPIMPLWYLPHIGRINPPTWDNHPAMQEIKKKCDDMKYHILVREHFLLEKLDANKPGISLQSMAEEMQAKVAICSLEAAGAMLLLHKTFLDNIYTYEYVLDFENNRNRLQQSLFWATAIVKKAQAQNTVQRKQSLHLETSAMRILAHWCLKGEALILCLHNYLMDLLLFVWNAPDLHHEFNAYRDDIMAVCVSQNHTIMDSTHYLKDSYYCHGEEPMEVQANMVLSSTQLGDKHANLIRGTET
ncbi:hypothetical protein J3459_010289 [Metarhizium acridum]|nr:hypothetical protein J3459_010289 [Metarhizium acridum]